MPKSNKRHLAQPRSSSRSSRRQAGSGRGNGRASRPGGQAELQSSRAAGIGSRAVEAVRAHPIPAILIGAGVTWLILENTAIGSSGPIRRSRRALGDLGETFSESFIDSARTTRRAMRGAAQTAAGAVGSSLSEGLSAIGDYAHGGVETVGSALSDAAGTIRRGAQRGYRATRRTIAQTMDDHPLAACAAVLAAGVATGMILPASRQEIRAIGPASQQVAQRVRATGNKLLRQGRKLAGDTATTIEREARRQGLEPRQLRKKIKRVASSAKDAVIGE